MTGSRDSNQYLLPASYSKSIGARWRLIKWRDFALSDWHTRYDKHGTSGHDTGLDTGLDDRHGI